MRYEEIESNRIKEIIEEMTKITGVDYTSINYGTALEIMKIAELRFIGEQLAYLVDKEPGI